jgi:anti-sigma B factor antagonist
MEIKEYSLPGYVTLVPTGDLDANSSVYLDEKLRSLIDRNLVFIHIDCSGVPYISSPGLGVFISYLDELNSRGGKFVLSHLAENVADVFTLLGLDQLTNLVLLREETEIGPYFEQR